MKPTNTAALQAIATLTQYIATQEEVDGSEKADQMGVLGGTQTGRFEAGTAPFLVNLTMFNKDSGKFKYEGSYHSYKTELYEIFHEVRVKYERRELPGLAEGHSWDYIVHIYVPLHPYCYPHIILPPTEKVKTDG